MNRYKSISRIDSTRAHGWFVRVVFLGKRHAKFFSENNIVPGGGTGGIDTIATAHAVADTLEAEHRKDAADAVRNVARLAAGYWEDLEEFGRLKDELADAMGHDFKCPIDVMHRAIEHFSEAHPR